MQMDWEITVEKRICVQFALVIFNQFDWLSDGETVLESFRYISGLRQVKSS